MIMKSISVQVHARIRLLNISKKYGQQYVELYTTLVYKNARVRLNNVLQWSYDSMFLEKWSLRFYVKNEAFVL